MNDFVRLVPRIESVQFAALLGFLVFLCFRTRSKGLIWIAGALTLMKLQVLSYIAGIVCNVFNIGIEEHWYPGSDRSLLRLEITMTVNGIEIVLGYSLCLLGAFLIYKEWRQGKFRQPEPEPLQER